MNRQIEVEELALIITGGEYRRKLPGRGITIVTRYRPAAEVIDDLAIGLSEQLPVMFERWTRSIAKAERKAVRRMAYLARKNHTP